MTSSVYPNKDSFHSCIVHVKSINEHTVELYIPEWHYYNTTGVDTVAVDIKDIPIMFFGMLLDCPVMTAKVNLYVLEKKDLIIKDYKLV